MSCVDLSFTVVSDIVACGNNVSLVGVSLSRSVFIVLSSSIVSSCLRRRLIQ